MGMPTTKPEVELSDNDGNAFSIIGTCTRTARRAGWTKEQIKQFTDEATSGDYDTVLQTAMKYFDVS